jgi:hypothetical protein
MLFGLFFKLDNEGYQNYMSLFLLIVIISYLILGELIFKKSPGKYLFGIGIFNKETSKTSPSARFFIGIAVLIALLFSFRIAMGFAVRHTDFYEIGKDYLETRYDVKIDGLTKVVDQKRNSVNFIVPVSSENNDRHGIVYLNRNDEGWRADSARFTKEHILGFSYGMSYGKAR